MLLAPLLDSLRQAFFWFPQVIVLREGKRDAQGRNLLLIHGNLSRIMPGRRGAGGRHGFGLVPYLDFLTMIDADYFVVCLLLSCSWCSPSSLLPPTNRTLCTTWITFLATTTRRREGGGFPVWLCPRTSTLWHRLTTPPCNFGCTTPTRRTKPPLASKVFNWTQMSPLWHSLLKKNSSW